MPKEIIIEADLGLKGVEKTDIVVYEDGKRLETYNDGSFDQLKKIAAKFKVKYPKADIQIWCLGESACNGQSYRWNFINEE